MSKYIEGDIECPFYIEEGRDFITCEGVVSRMNCKHTFPTDTDKRNFESDYCCVKGGRSCPHHRAVAMLYETGKRV